MAERLLRLITGQRARGLGVAALAGVFLAMTGAFGSGEAGLALRLAYWVPLMVLAAVWAGAAVALVNARLPLADRPVARFLAYVLVISTPLSVVVWAATGPVFTGRFYPPALLPGFLGRVALITAAMTAIGMALDRRDRPREAPEETPSPARFLARLPLRLRGAAIVAVQAEDHYLRIHTERGSDLILMRLSDAVAELEGLDGARTHRSWWVARDAVTGVRRGDGRATLTLKTGLEIPVSRRYARALRAAGWY